MDRKERLISGIKSTITIENESGKLCYSKGTNGGERSADAVRAAKRLLENMSANELRRLIWSGVDFDVLALSLQETEDDFPTNLKDPRVLAEINKYEADGHEVRLFHDLGPDKHSEYLVWNGMCDRWVGLWDFR